MALNPRQLVAGVAVVGAVVVGGAGLAAAQESDDSTSTTEAPSDQGTAPGYGTPPDQGSGEHPDGDGQGCPDGAAGAEDGAAAEATSST